MGHKFTHMDMGIPMWVQSCQALEPTKISQFWLFWHECKIHKLLRTTQQKIVTLGWQQEGVNSLTATGA
jgi:hypothetical protein